MPNLFIDIEARFAKFQDSLDQIARKAGQSAGQIDKAFGALKGTLATLGATLTVGALKSFVQSSIDAADHLNDLSKKTGISVENIGGLGFAAQQSGGSLDSMADAAGKLNRSIAEAGAGNAEKSEAFRLLGVNVRDATGNLKSADVVMAELADKFASYADGPNKVALAVKLFGKAGADIIPTLDEGGQKLRENIGYFERYSGITKDVADKADQFNDTLVKLNLLSGALGTKIASELLGPLQGMADGLLAAKEKSQLFETASAGLRVVFEALIVLGSEVAFTFKGVGTEIGGIAAQIAALGRLDFKGFANIGKEMKKDAAEARAAHDAFIDSILKRPKLTAADLDDAAAGKVRVDRAKPQAPGLPDAGAAAKAEAARKALDALTDARSKIAVDAEKNAATSRLAVLDHFYKEGFAGEERYWQVRGEIQRQAYAVERAALDANVTSRQAALDNATRTKGKGSKEYYDALKDLAEAQAKRNTLDAAFNAQGVTDVLARAKATEDYERAIKNVNIQLDELKGNTAAAASAQFDLQNERLRKDAAGRNDPQAQAQIDALRDATAAQAQFNELKDRATQVTDRLAIQEERIQNAQRVGAISELEALRQTDTARKNALQTLGLTQQQLDAVAQSSGLEKLRLDAEKFGVSLETLASQSNLLGDRYKKVFEDSFGDEFAKVIDGTEKVSDAFKNMGKRIIAELANIQARSIAQGLSNAVQGAIGSSSSGGGFFSSLLSGLGGLFGSGGGGSALSGATSYGTLTAYGGRRSAGQPLRVGENGPELWIPETAGTMIPNSQLSPAGGGAGAGGDIIIHAPGADPQQLAALTAQVRAMREDMRRGTSFVNAARRNSTGGYGKR